MDVSQAAVLVAGGSSGLGAACVERLAGQGAKVLVADVRPPRDDLPAGAEYREADVTDEASLQAAIEAAAALGELRGAVVCAGVIHGERICGREGPFDLDAFRRVIEVNLVGSFNVLRLAAAAMQHNSPDQQQERGAVVLTSSVAAYEGQIGQAAYAASKGGVASLALPAARELGRLGIRVVAVAPGVFDTPMMQQVPDDYRQSLESQTPFPPRFGRPAEFAAFVQQILENPMLNGSVLRIDGAIRMTAK